MTKKTPEMRARAIAMRKAGMTMKAIAETLGVSVRAVKQWTDPEAARRDLEMQKKRRAAENSKGPIYKHKRGPNDPTEDEVRRLLDLVPADSRDLTGRVFGDPIPGDPRRPHLRRPTTTKEKPATTSS